MNHQIVRTIISTLQETVCDIGDTTPSRAMNLLSDSSSSYRSTVAWLALHESPGVSEQAMELLEALLPVHTRIYRIVMDLGLDV